MHSAVAFIRWPWLLQIHADKEEIELAHRAIEAVWDDGAASPAKTVKDVPTDPVTW